MEILDLQRLPDARGSGAVGAVASRRTCSAYSLADASSARAEALTRKAERQHSKQRLSDSTEGAIHFTITSLWYERQYVQSRRRSLIRA